MAVQLARLSDESLLEMRLCDLPIRIQGTLKRRVNQLYRELKNRGIRFRPHVWLSEEFFTPDGVPGIAIPFYLAHPRLMKMERKQMLEVEGGTSDWCMRILRHEAGHALDNAYRLHTRASWRKVFGSFGQKYPESYRPKPNSRNYVLHLDAWYAQAHPAEDYAETFAVWLRPGARWRRRYHGWAAMKKLIYMDNLMKRIAGMPTKNWVRAQVEPLHRLRMTLRQYYRRKRLKYSLEFPAYYDRNLRRIFSDEPRYASRPTAADFLRRSRRELRTLVAEGSGVHSYTVDQLLDNIIQRAKELKLRMKSSHEKTRQEAMILLTVHTMNIVYSGHYRFQYGL
jgi:hypothetical protein